MGNTAGILTAQCDWAVQTAFTVFAWWSSYISIPAFAYFAAFIFGGWIKYDTKYLPTLALHPWLNWLGWVITHTIIGAISWIIYYFSGQWCETWEVLGPLLAFNIPLTAWPVAVFVFNSFLFGWLLMAFMAIWTIITLVLTIIFIADNIVIQVILHIMIFVWFVYNAIWMFLAWRCDNYEFISAGKTIENLINGLGIKDTLKCKGNRPLGFGAQATIFSGGATPANGGSYTINPVTGNPAFVSEDIEEAQSSQRLSHPSSFANFNGNDEAISKFA